MDNKTDLYMAEIKALQISRNKIMGLNGILFVLFNAAIIVFLPYKGWTAVQTISGIAALMLLTGIIVTFVMEVVLNSKISRMLKSINAV